MNTLVNTLPQVTTEQAEPTSVSAQEDVSPRTNNVPQVDAPSIGSSAMLSELSISQWTGRKKDRKASKDVTADNNAETGVANIRNIHYGMTMPWSDTGLRLLPTAQYFKYHTAMTDLENQWRAATNTFLQSYQWEISQAQAKLGDLFDATEYPTTDALTTKFGFNLNYIPLPDAGDFRIDVGNDAVAEVKSSYGDYYARQLTKAMNDVWIRLHDALTRMSERLDYGADDDKRVFRDSLVSNVTDMVELLTVCNVTGDAQMTAMRDKLSDAMYGVTAEVLREDTHTRTETKRTVDQVISSLPSLEV